MSEQFVPKVSIVVPVYNAGKLLHKCIKSLLKQTFKEIEIILVNDGSTDNSLKICQHYQNKDNRVVVIDKKNGGSVAARFDGIKIARADYVTFADADDWANKKLVEVLYNEAINNNLDIAVCNSYRVLGPVRKKNTSRYFKEDKLFVDNEEIKKVLGVCYLWGHAFPATLHGKLYKKELLLNSGKYIERIKFMGDDMFYNLEMLLKAKRVKTIIKPLYYYRLGGFTSKYMPHFFSDVINGYEIQKEVIDEYYTETKEYETKGICFMLINMLKSSMHNLFNSNLSENEKRDLIKSYITHPCILEGAGNKLCRERMNKDVLAAIDNVNVEYFYQFGKTFHEKKRAKRFIMKILAKFPTL